MVAGFRYRKLRRERMLRKMANMRAAKERRRLEWPQESAPRFERWFPLEVGVRDRATGETAWIEFRSLRGALRALRVVQRYYVPGIPTRKAVTSHRTPKQSKDDHVS